MIVRKERVLEMLKDEQVIVINVLSKIEYKKIHIKGSENHPLIEDHVAFSKEIAEKYGKEKSFIFYGERFGILDGYEATKAMNDRGLQAENYSGGMLEWNRAGLPVEGTEVIA